MITIDDFAKIEIKLGTIIEADFVPDADKLLRLKIDFGTEVRQIVSGIREYYPDPSALIGKQIPVLTNLEPRMIKGLESNGMIVAAGDEDDFTLLESTKKVTNGTAVR
ncbi:MAG: methionine--tRNA ligase subunit beta [Candidatus Pacebacteria bacterium]|jgi:methionyl-tRNA synthetase|nr:methionine--tRNA ligase subunit beta [Candidatus Paceibacterota bacterium]